MTLLYVAVGVVLVLWIISKMNQANLRRLQDSGLYPPAGQGTDEHVKNLAKAGHKIEAIKLYREIHGTDLKDSKDAVEKMASGKL